jgi:hypothetical protein
MPQKSLQLCNRLFKLHDCVNGLFGGIYIHHYPEFGQKKAKDAENQSFMTEFYEFPVVPTKMADNHLTPHDGAVRVLTCLPSTLYVITSS